MTLYREIMVAIGGGSIGLDLALRCTPPRLRRVWSQASAIEQMALLRLVRPAVFAGLCRAMRFSEDEVQELVDGPPSSDPFADWWVDVPLTEALAAEPIDAPTLEEIVVAAAERDLRDMR